MISVGYIRPKKDVSHQKNSEIDAGGQPLIFRWVSNFEFLISSPIFIL